MKSFGYGKYFVALIIEPEANQTNQALHISFGHEIHGLEVASSGASHGTARTRIKTSGVEKIYPLER